jgi:predicted CoA-binding protein
VEGVSDATLTLLLRSVERIAVVGIKAGEADDAFRVPRYMQARGYRILPVSPKLERVLGERCVPTLADLEENPQLVNLFRAPVHVPAHTDEILALPEPPRGVWMQLGVRHDERAARLEAAGITVVQDRCLMVEHRRLLGAAGPR